MQHALIGLALAALIVLSVPTGPASMMGFFIMWTALSILSWMFAN